MYKAVKSEWGEKYPIFLALSKKIILIINHENKKR